MGGLTAANANSSDLSAITMVTVNVMASGELRVKDWRVAGFGIFMPSDKPFQNLSQG